MKNYILLNGEKRGYEDVKDIQIGEFKDIVSQNIVGYWAGVEFPGEPVSLKEYERLSAEGAKAGSDISAFKELSTGEYVGFDDAYEIQITIIRDGGDKSYVAYYHDGDYRIDEDTRRALEDAGARVEEEVHEENR